MLMVMMAQGVVTLVEYGRYFISYPLALQNAIHPLLATSTEFLFNMPGK
jgi:hypothetical protein